jgi:hypothetical protein
MTPTLKFSSSPGCSVLRTLALVVMFMVPVVGWAADPLSVRITYLGERDTDSWHGAMQGLDEANAQGKFLRLRYELVNANDQADALALNGVAIIADVSPLRLLRVSELAFDTPVFNVSAADDDLREACQPNLLHTLPSLAMLDDALQQWRRKRPGSEAIAQAWHPRFRKYAAAQLNKRYTKRVGRSMSDAAWAGWAAVKLLADTIARLGVAESSTVLEALHTDLAFDGQKGVDLSFRNTGQLRQPLLLIEDGKIVGEAPVAGIVAASNLDSLGLADCRK